MNRIFQMQTNQQPFAARRIEASPFTATLCNHPLPQLIYIFPASFIFKLGTSAVHYFGTFGRPCFINRNLCTTHRWCSAGISFSLPQVNNHPMWPAMEGRRALCLALLASAIVSVWSTDEVAVSGQPPATAMPGPDTNVLCVSKCGTCPTVCSSPPPAPPSSSAGDNSVTPPPKSGGYSSPPGQGKGDRPSSNYYYFFTAAASRRSSCAGAGVYAVVVLALVSAVANLR